MDNCEDLPKGPVGSDIYKMTIVHVPLLQFSRVRVKVVGTSHQAALALSAMLVRNGTFAERACDLELQSNVVQIM